MPGPFSSPAPSALSSPALLTSNPFLFDAGATQAFGVEFLGSVTLLYAARTSDGMTNGTLSLAAATKVTITPSGGDVFALSSSAGLLTLGADAASSDTDVSVNIVSKGAGVVQINGSPVASNPLTTAGDIYIGGAAGAPARLADVATGSVLTSGGVGVAPAWSATPRITRLQVAATHGVDTAAAGTLVLGETNATAITLSVATTIAAGGLAVSAGISAFSAAVNVTDTTATAFTVAAAGANYGLQVDASTANAVTGLKITAKAANAGLALAVISTATNENATLDAKGSGTITIAGTSTGGVTVGHALTVSTGGIAVTGNSTIAGTLGSLTGLTLASGLISGGGDVTAGDYVAMPTAWNTAKATGAGPGLANADHSHGTMLDNQAYGLAYGTDPRYSTNTASTWPAANTALFVRAEGGLAVVNIIFVSAISSGNYDVGIYTNTGVGVAANPNSRVANKGSTAMPVAGIVTAAVGSTNNCVQGAHWLALSIDNNTAVVNNAGTNASDVAGFYASMATAFPLPSSASGFGSRSLVPYMVTS